MAYVKGANIKILCATSGHRPLLHCLGTRDGHVCSFCCARCPRQGDEVCEHTDVLKTIVTLLQKNNQLRMIAKLFQVGMLGRRARTRMCTAHTVSKLARQPTCNSLRAVTHKNSFGCLKSIFSQPLLVEAGATMTMSIRTFRGNRH